MSHLDNAVLIEASISGEYLGRWDKYVNMDGGADWLQTVGVVEDTEEEEDGLVERDGMLFCGCCGNLASPGEEEWDWCDHVTGGGCAYAPEEDTWDEDLDEREYN